LSLLRMSLEEGSLALVVLNWRFDMGLPFLKGQAKRRDQILSLDLGGRTTKAVYLQRKGDRFSLQNFAVFDSPASEKPVTALAPEMLAEHLKEVARTLGGRGKQVTLAVGVAETVFRQVEMPPMPVSDMRRMIKFNSRNYLQQDLQDYTFDCCYFVPPGTGRQGGSKPGVVGQKQKVIVGGIKQQALENLETAIKVAGLMPDQVVPGLAGPINAFELAQPELFASEVVGLVDIGFKNTSITILDGGEIVLNRVVAIGGDRITVGLAETMGISYTEAENIKQGMTEEIEQNLEMLLNPLGRELRASIDFYEHQQDKTVPQVFVSGGTARNETILEVLQAELMVPCKAWNPTRFLEPGLPAEKMGDLELVAPQLTVAVGAAVAGF
jgi:type IV pilus assembly protein PilM